MNAYAYLSYSDISYPAPAAMAYLRGGVYTELYVPMTSMPLMHAAFVEGPDTDTERWGDQFQGLNPEYWFHIEMTQFDYTHADSVSIQLEHDAEAVEELAHFLRYSFDRWTPPEGGWFEKAL